MQDKLKILIFSYYWPPSGGSGVQRWMYFSKYLPKFNVEPTVITVDERSASYHTMDETLNKEVEHIRVIKTKTLEPLKIYSLLKSGNSKKAIPQGSLSKKKGFLDKIASYVRGNFFIPDARVGWNSYAYPKAMILLKKAKFDVIITTGPPHSTHLIGKAIKEKYPKLKWIADFRDPWQEVFYNESFFRTEKSKLKDAEYELSVLEGADLITTVGPSMKELLETKIPENKHKIKVLYNGFDSNKFEKIFRNKSQKFEISFIGFLGNNYPVDVLKTILDKLDASFIGKNTRLNLIGKIDNEALNTLSGFKFIEVHKSSNVSHDEAIQKMLDSHLLLLLLPLNDYSKILVSGKLLEYLASNNPILGIMNPDCDAANIINEYKLGKVFSPTDSLEEAYQFIKETFETKDAYKVQRDAYALFNRKAVTEQLANEIKKLIS